MSDSADFEEGEVDDISDFEDGNPGDVGTVFPLGDGSCDGSPSHRGVSHGSWRETYRDRDVRDTGVSHKHGERTKESLLRFLSDDEPTSRRKTSGVKRKRKRREWVPGSAERAQGTRQDRAKCRFYLEGRCNKGSECPFSHGFTPAKKQELCKFYATGGCSKGSSCPFLHGEFPCKFFHLSKNCYHGGNCKFSHKPLTPSTRSLLDKLVDDQNRSSRSAESAIFNREASSMYAPPITQFPQGALTEPYGDVDYRHMVHSGSTGMGIQPGVPCGFQPSPQAVGRRPPLESHAQHFRRSIDESRLRPPPGYGGPQPFRGPFPPPYRFHPGKSYPLPHRPPLASGNREPSMPYPPQRFRPPYHDNGGENFCNNSSTNADDYSPEQFTRLTDLKKQETKPSSPPPLESPVNDQREVPPKMTVSKDIVVYLNEKPSAGTTPVTFKWHIIPLELDKNPHQPPPSATNANPADPRLKARPQLPVLLTIPSASTEEKQSEVKNPPQPERRKRPKLTLNEMANTFAKTGHRVQSKTPVLYSNILDPRLLKRQKIESEVASPETAVDEEQSLTPKALRVVFSP
ncbi:Zinc finger CCCH domain-containing protein 4 [Taenia solium]|eukprot:TsM_000727200 transcript=TsM_000727200 gene=TsM_000727200